MQILENEPMSKHTSFKVGGPARFFVKAESLADLREAFAFARDKRLPRFILGNEFMSRLRVDYFLDKLIF